MKLREEIFEIKGKDGLTRRGILAGPENFALAETAVLFVVAGLKYRTGPHRWYVRFARKLAERGILALRIDPIGIGESDGLIEKNATHEIWLTVENGRFVEDTILAAQEIRQRYAVKNVLLIGICGGAITSQLAAAANPDLIQGVVSINTALTLSLAPRAHIGTRKEAKHLLKAYLLKLRSVRAWFRFIRGASEFKAIRDSLLTLVQKDSVVEGQNPKFLSSFNKMIQSKQRHLLLFSEHDVRWFDFSSTFLKYELQSKLSGKGYEIVLIPQANHLLYLENWKCTAESHITQWISSH